MALVKQPVPINFGKGLDTKTDPYQINITNFAALRNIIFTTTNRLTKRLGFKNDIASVPSPTNANLTTLNNNLIAVNDHLYALNQDNNAWINQGVTQPVQLAVQPVVRVSTSQTTADSVIASNGLLLTTYVDNGQAYYQISDSVTNQKIVDRTTLPATATNPRAFVVGSYFVITFMATVTAATHLQFVAIPTSNINSPTVATDIASDANSLNVGYDGAVANNTLYVAYGATGTTVKLRSLDRNLNASAATTLAASSSDLMSVTIDTTNRVVLISYWDSGSTNGYAASFNYSRAPLMAPTQIITAMVLTHITSVADSGIATILYEIDNNYSYDANINTDYVRRSILTVPTTGTGTIVSDSIMLRSVGLASKAFFDTTGTIYVLVVYGDTHNSPATGNSNQSTYFLSDSSGNIVMRLAYANAGGYLQSQVLPSVTSISDSFNVPYLVTDFLTTVNKGTNIPSGTPTNAIYTQTGINLATFTLDSTVQYSNEIASALHLTGGGQLWEYDSVKPVEHGFHVWPENVESSTATGAGSIAAGTYYYSFTYEWTDAQGLLHRSAPSIPVKQVTTTASSTNTIRVPTLRLTYKTAPNPVRIVGYRWSVAQQVYYQFTSVTSPTLNNPAVDSVTFTDTLADSSILGTTILYTTGGVLENIAAPASVASALFNNRLWIIDAEDRNLLWYSKQVIEAVPVEMSDLLTLYVAPTTGAQQSTGPSTALSAMDDKLIIFKQDAIYYVNGTGPDNTGANSTYSDAVFITSSVGCSNPNSIVLTPTGLMFQSNKGIWLLSRDTGTSYIGAPVEGLTSSTVLSALIIPGTTQVRFILDNSLTLMYDYFQQQWAVHTNILAVSSTIHQGSHAYINSNNMVFQENNPLVDTERLYLDGSEPVLIGLTTAWINVAGLQGYERFYFANLLGTYKSPFILNASIAYDYNPSAFQATQILPYHNPTTAYGDQSVYGSGSYGNDNGAPNSANVFTARLFPEKQKCQAFQLSLDEYYDASFGQSAGEGLTLSGLLLMIGMKRGSRTQSANKSFG